MSLIYSKISTDPISLRVTAKFLNMVYNKVPWSGSLQPLWPFLCFSLTASTHSGLLAIPKQVMAHFHMKAFLTTVPSAHNILSPCWS